MWVKSCDFSYDQPDPATLFKAGYRVILGYVSHTPGKGMSAAYVARALKAGLRIVPLYETSADMALGGKPAGARAAATATVIAWALGCPRNVPIIYALDQDYSGAQMAGPVSQFIEGLHSVAGPDGEYGGIDQLRYVLKHNGPTDAKFQTYAWSHGQWMPAADAAIRQTRNGVRVAGGTVDEGLIDLARITTWGPTEGAGMARTLSDEDVIAVAHAIWTYPIPNGTGRNMGQDMAELEARTNASANVQGPAEAVTLADISAKLDKLAAAVTVLPAK